MGARAIAALKKFQSDHGLPATGQLDRETLDALTIGHDHSAARAGRPPTRTTSKEPEKYRALTPLDGLSCSVDQNLRASVGPRDFFSGTITGVTFELYCIDKIGQWALVPIKSVEKTNGRTEIKTWEFGTFIWDDAEAGGSEFEMTESQIKSLRTFLNF
jgi:peptidoglycan hydrolase-like protein with peptidoglycan-binding domain